MEKPKIRCESPVEGEEGHEIESWKYYAIRRVIIRILEEQETGVLESDLPVLVEAIISDPQTRANIGFIPWYTLVVQHDLEAKKEIVTEPEEDTVRLKLKS